MEVVTSCYYVCGPPENAKTFMIFIKLTNTTSIIYTQNIFFFLDLKMWNIIQKCEMSCLWRNGLSDTEFSFCLELFPHIFALNWCDQGFRRRNLYKEDFKNHERLQIIKETQFCGPKIIVSINSQFKVSGKVEPLARSLKLKDQLLQCLYLS